MNDETLFFYSQDGTQRGPVALSRLRDLIRAGAVAPSVPIWCEGWSEWKPAADAAKTLALPLFNRALSAELQITEQRRSAWLRILGWCAAWFAVLILIGILVIKNLPEDIKREIQYKGIAQEAVLARLPSPRTADFENTKVETMKDGSIIISGDVHSQNAFGAMIRSRFFVLIENGTVSSVKIN